MHRQDHLETAENRDKRWTVLTQNFACGNWDLPGGRGSETFGLAAPYLGMQDKRLNNKEGDSAEKDKAGWNITDHGQKREQPMGTEPE